MRGSPAETTGAVGWQLAYAMRLAAGLAALLGLMASWSQAPATAGGRFTLAKTIPSRILGRPITYTIYRPDSRQAGARFPVLYLLHGLGDNENAWLEHGGIRQTLDRLIDSGRIKPLIMVMPMAGNSWYVDDARKAGYGPMARALGEDFIAGIDGRYHTHACRERRALARLSPTCEEHRGCDSAKVLLQQRLELCRR